MLIDTTKMFMKAWDFKEVPVLNEPNMLGTTFITQPENYKEILRWIKRTPEAIVILNAIITDITSDGIIFIELERVRTSGKQKKESAKRFWRSNQGREQLKAALFDWLCLGNGALWKGKLGLKEIKEAYANALPPSWLEFKETDMRAFMDEDSRRTKKFLHVAWSTMNIELTEDKTGVLKFRQVVPGAASGKESIEYSPDEIIHAKFMNFDGKAYGFSPMIASMSVISTLGLLKDSNGFYFENGGVPDWMFILPEEMAGSPNHKALVQTLQKYKNTRNKHGNLVFTGNVETRELSRFDKDMEFHTLAMYYTGVLALAFNMPMARVAAIIGGSVKQNAGASDLSEAGYWRTISSAQDYWEDLLNQQLFEPEFGVQIRFKRGYRNDEIKEAQRDVQGMQVATELLRLGAVKPEYLKDRLQIPDRYWTGKVDLEKLEPMKTAGAGPGQQKFGSDSETLPGPASKAKRERKKAEQTRT